MKVLFSVLVILIAFSLSGCSNDPDAPPKFRVQNLRLTDASLQVKTSGGNTININNVKPGSVSAYQEVAEGVVEITVSIQNEPGDFKASFVAVNNKTFTIVVNNTTPPAVVVVNP